MEASSIGSSLDSLPELWLVPSLTRYNRTIVQNETHRSPLNRSNPNILIYWLAWEPGEAFGPGVNAQRGLIPPST